MTGAPAGDDRTAAARDTGVEEAVARVAIEGERHELLERVAGALETPMAVLGLAWLALLVVELTHGLSPFLENLGLAIWGLFIVQFLLELVIAPRKVDYLRRHWLTALSLALPALRVFRAVRAVRALQAARAARGVRLARVLTSLNRGMRSLGASMSRRGMAYVVALTALVVLAGAAGMYAFERETPGTGIASYGDAVWWTAMIMTTLGSEYWPRTAEGRVLCIILALYAFGIFGYITATLASFFVGRDAQEDSVAPLREELRGEMRALREELRRMREGS